MSIEYLPKFIEGASVEQLQNEMKEMYMAEYRSGRTIDKPRLWDIVYTLKQKIIAEGIVDTKKYRYRVDGNEIKRIALDALDTTAALTNKSHENPHGWQTVADI